MIEDHMTGHAGSHHIRLAVESDSAVPAVIYRPIAKSAIRIKAA